MVTGGAGFIGSNYIKYLHDNHRNEIDYVVCVDILTYASNLWYLQNYIDSGFVVFYKLGICNPYIKNLIINHKVQYVVNFAAETHVDNSIQDSVPFVDTNILGTIDLLENCKGTDIKKFVHVSTDEVYGSLSAYDYAFTEQSQYEPNSPYAASKACSDHWVRAYNKTFGVPTVITNCSNNYGPNQHKEKLIPKVIINAMNGDDIPVYGNGFNIRDWLFVEDHCHALYLVMTKGEVGQKYNIGGGHEVSNITLIRRILDLMGKSHQYIKHVPDRLGHDFRYSIDCRKIEQELGYKPKTDLTEGLEKTIGWYKQWHQPR